MRQNGFEPNSDPSKHLPKKEKRLLSIVFFVPCSLLLPTGIGTHLKADFSSFLVQSTKLTLVTRAGIEPALSSGALFKLPSACVKGRIMTV